MRNIICCCRKKKKNDLNNKLENNSKKRKEEEDNSKFSINIKEDLDFNKDLAYITMACFFISLKFIIYS